MAHPAAPVPPSEPLLEEADRPSLIEPVSSVRPVMRLPPPAPETQAHALGALAILAVVAVLWVIRPIGLAILLGTLNAFVMRSLYERLLARKQRFAAASTVVVSSLAIAGGLALLVYFLVARGAVIGASLMEELAPGTELRTRFDALLHRLLPNGAPDLLTQAREAATSLAARAAAITAAVATTTFGTILGLFFMLLTTHFVLRHWATIERRLADMLPLHPRHTSALLEEFRVIGRAALLGTVVTGLAQGVLAAIGYWVSGLPEPAFFGALTAVASLLPAVGTMLIWVPAGLYLLAMHHITGGILCLVWSALIVVGFSDYVLRPRLLGRNGEMPALLTLAALFGGVESLGLPGLIIGPVVTAIGFATLRIYAIETANRHQDTLPPDTDSEAQRHSLTDTP